MSLRNRVNEELEALRIENGGTLKQERVVEYAQRDPHSALHEDFDRQGLWDDARAAHVARLEYAGRLIRLYVVKPKGADAPPVRALVSLVDDRKKGSGFPGYRSIGDVMEDQSLRASLLQTARMELRAFRRKYEQLTELSEVWDAVERIEVRYTAPTDESHQAATA